MREVGGWRGNSSNWSAYQRSLLTKGSAFKKHQTTEVAYLKRRVEQSCILMGKATREGEFKGARLTVCLKTSAFERVKESRETERAGALNP